MIFCRKYIRICIIDTVKEVTVIKLFKTLLVLIPCLLITVLVIVAFPEKDKYIIDLEGDLDAYEDPKLVNNSDIGFFYKNDQLYEHRQQKKADKTNVIKMSENIVTTDFTKENISIVPDKKNTYTGPHNVVLTSEGVQEYVEATEVGYTLKGGKQVAKEDTFEIILETGLFGKTPAIPHKVEQVNKYYAAFTQQVQDIYFEFTSSNEFASIKVSELKGRVEYTLLDSTMKPLKNGWNNSKSEIEIQYKGRSAAKYYLKLSGSYSKELTPFCVEIPSDNNEWMWQMVYASIGKTTSGTFDYYGDEDFFVLPKQITDNINKSILKFTEIAADANVVIYDNKRNILAQYVYKKDDTNMVSLYSLKNAYAISVYSYEQKNTKAKYSFVLEYIDTLILDIQTYGFALSPGYSDKEDYYTASVSSLDGKQITEIMTTIPSAKTQIKVTQQCGYEYIAKEGENLNLAPGRNVISISFTVDDLSRTIEIVVSHRANEVYYGFTTDGEKIFIVDDKTKDNHVQIQKSDGKYEWIKRSKVFSYIETTMPDSYKKQINALQKKHPQWKFTFVKTGFDFKEYVDSQDRIEGKTPVSTINSKRATREQIEYYVDPRNFLDEKNIFMFEKQTYTKGIYSSTGMESIWVELPAAELSEKTFVSYFTEAGQSAGISPYFITARAQLESGNGTSKLALGTITGCEGYYNFYGINAINTNPSAGGEFAKENNWNTKRKAVIEGAAWVKNQYIGCMQYSAYFMKYSFIPTRLWHQYMTDIAAPSKDAKNYYTAHLTGGTLDSQIEFVIPVFDNMPEPETEIKTETK